MSNKDNTPKNINVVSGTGVAGGACASDIIKYTRKTIDWRVILKDQTGGSNECLLKQGDIIIRTYDEKQLTNTGSFAVDGFNIKEKKFRVILALETDDEGTFVLEEMDNEGEKA